MSDITAEVETYLKQSASDTEISRELESHLKQLGHNVRVTVTTTNDGMNVNVHMIGPAWLYMARWLAHLPGRGLGAAADQLDVALTALLDKLSRQLIRIYLRTH